MCHNNRMIKQAKRAPFRIRPSKTSCILLYQINLAFLPLFPNFQIHILEKTGLAQKSNQPRTNCAGRHVPESSTFIFCPRPPGSKQNCLKWHVPEFFFPLTIPYLYSAPRVKTKLFKLSKQCYRISLPHSSTFIYVSLESIKQARSRFPHSYSACRVKNTLSEERNSILVKTLLNMSISGQNEVKILLNVSYEAKMRSKLYKM